MVLGVWGGQGTREEGGRHFESGIPATFVVISHEAPPQGFSPAPLETGPWFSKIEGSGVVTLALARRINTKDFGRRDPAGPERIEHVDDSAPVISADGDLLEYGKEHTYVIPIDGPRGERLSQAYRIKMGDDPTLAKVGDPMPRVHLRNDGLAHLFVYGDEPDLVLTVTKDYRVSKPPRGVLGGKPVGSHFLVRWDGERGEGWSLAVGTDASEIKDAGPLWKVVRQVRLSEGPVVVGERVDGAGCDVTFVKFDWDMRVEPTRAPQCDDALLAMETKMKEVRLAKDVASAKDEAERQAKRAARLAAEKRADAERAEQTRKEEEQQRKEAPILAEYDEALKKNDLRLACTIASSHFDSKRHARHALQRWAKGGSPAEIKCARQGAGSCTQDDASMGVRACGK